MRILTHNIHTGYDLEMAKTGHEFFATSYFKAWDPALRLPPPNWHLIDRHEDMDFDLVLVSHSWDLVERFRSVKAPMVFNIIADCSEGVFPLKDEERCTAICFLAREVAARWALKDESKKRVIEMGVDDTPFLPHTGEDARALTVGHRIGQRWDKGHCPYVTIAQVLPSMPLTLVGPGNEGLPGAVGTLEHARLMEMYSRARVYFNPGPIIGISVAEAMMAGMPVVAFRPINLCDLIVDGLNGYIVDTVDGAIMRLQRLLENPELALAMGKAAKEAARKRFDSGTFVTRWNALFAEAARR